MIHYIAIAGEYETSYSVIGPFTTKQVRKETLRLCADCDYRPDEDKLLQITIQDNGEMDVNEIESYKRKRAKRA